MIIPYNAHHQEKRLREETDPQLQEYMEVFSAKDAILEQGTTKSFEQYINSCYVPYPSNCSDA